MGREVLEQLGIVQRFADNITDTRDPKRCKVRIEELLYQMVRMLGQGWGHQSGSRAMRNDPAMWAATASRRGRRDERPGVGFAGPPSLAC